MQVHGLPAGPKGDRPARSSRLSYLEFTSWVVNKASCDAAAVLRELSATEGRPACRLSAVSPRSDNSTRCAVRSVCGYLWLRHTVWSRSLWSSVEEPLTVQSFLSE